ncbi:hypothetical protein [Azospirillum sp. SYSU D00513]|uniref:hypothetical protein n=1 Tax=Azospirillum sp. SYSU D00513 TaxID=2812561 RepID=UPI001A97B49A|nr:hypothetical protein [Azospirillum sp. SYSU D00513]
MPDKSSFAHRNRDKPIIVSGEQARQGEIVLNTPRRRWIFVSGLVGFILLALLGGLLF